MNISQVQLLLGVLSSRGLRGSGNTTAVINGLKSVGGGTILMPTQAHSHPYRHLHGEFDIEVTAMTTLGKFTGKEFTKPVLLDPYALICFLGGVIEEETNSRAELTKLLEMVEQNYISIAIATYILPEILRGESIESLLSKKG